MNSKRSKILSPFPQRHLTLADLISLAGNTPHDKILLCTPEANGEGIVSAVLNFWPRQIELVLAQHSKCPRCKEIVALGDDCACRK